MHCRRRLVRLQLLAKEFGAWEICSDAVEPVHDCGLSSQTIPAAGGGSLPSAEPATSVDGAKVMRC